MSKAKQGWGFSGKENNAKLDLTQKTEKKVNIWEKAGEADDIQFIPDAETESSQNPQNQISSLGQQVTQKVQDFNELQKLTKNASLPQTEEGVDLSVLSSIMRPYDDITEYDEPWEFQKLKTDISEIVSQMYGSNKIQDDQV